MRPFRCAGLLVLLGLTLLGCGSPNIMIDEEPEPPGLEYSFLIDGRWDDWSDSTGVLDLWNAFLFSEDGEGDLQFRHRVEGDCFVPSDMLFVGSYHGMVHSTPWENSAHRREAQPVRSMVFSILFRDPEFRGPTTVDIFFDTDPDAGVASPYWTEGRFRPDFWIGFHSAPVPESSDCIGLRSPILREYSYRASLDGDWIIEFDPSEFVDQVNQDHPCHLTFIDEFKVVPSLDADPDLHDDPLLDPGQVRGRWVEFAVSMDYLPPLKADYPTFGIKVTTVSPLGSEAWDLFDGTRRPRY